MKNKRRWRYFFALSIVLYIIALGVAFLMIRNVPNLYVQLQKSENNKVNRIIKQASLKNNQKEYETIVAEYLVDFVVYNETTNKIEYSSIDIKNDVTFFDNNVNENLISSKSKLSVERGQDQLSLFVVEYYVSPQKTFDLWVIVLIIIIAVLLSIITISLVILFFKYIKPLDRLKKAVQDISVFQLNRLESASKSSEYDKLTNDLYEFSQELNQRLKDTGYKYSEIEQNLIRQNEEVLYRNKMLGSLAHDLKAPLALINLNIEKLKSFENEGELEVVQTKVNKVIEDINSLNQVAFNSINIGKEKENFNLIDLILTTYESYQELFNEHGLFTEFDLDEKVMLTQNKVRIKQLLDNLFANVYQHAKVDGEVNISCYLENEEVHLSIYNDATNINRELIENMTTLFYSTKSGNSNSGIGMYTIKLIVEELSGQLIIEPKDQGLVIKVVFRP